MAFNAETKNKNMRQMAWIGFIYTLAATTWGLYSGHFPPEYFYLFITGVLTAYFGFSKWGEIKGDGNANPDS